MFRKCAKYMPMATDLVLNTEKKKDCLCPSWKALLVSEVGAIWPWQSNTKHQVVQAPLHAAWYQIMNPLKKNPSYNTQQYCILFPLQFKGWSLLNSEFLIMGQCNFFLVVFPGRLLQKALNLKMQQPSLNFTFCLCCTTTSNSYYGNVFFLRPKKKWFNWTCSMRSQDSWCSGRGLSYSLR